MKAFRDIPLLFFRRVRNKPFRGLFLKNAARVFLCCFLPLIGCVAALYASYGARLLAEIDAANERGAVNAKTAIDSVLGEVDAAFKQLLLDEDVMALFTMERDEPMRTYEYYARARAVIAKLQAMLRSELYVSFDVYAGRGEYLVSTLYWGQSKRLLADDTLVSGFFEYAGAHPFAYTFARPGVIAEKDVVTLYRTTTVGGRKSCFVSASLSAEAWAKRVAGDADPDMGSFLLLDAEDNVLMDTSGARTGGKLTLEMDEREHSGATRTVDGVQMRVSWTALDRMNLKCVQIIPIDDYMRSMRELRGTLYAVVACGFFAAVLLTYLVTARLFRPVEAILQMVEHPSDEVVNLQKGEIQYLLIRLLALFQKNIAMEKEIVDRVATLRQARAKALQKQLSAHFLYNTLQAIDWLALSETGDENSKTGRAVGTLAELIRASFDQEANCASVREELAFVEKFMQIERLRFGDDVICHIVADEGALGAPLPRLALQTLVENAVSHGIKPRGSGNIYLSVAERECGGLRVTVEDDGCGMSEEAQVRLRGQMREEFVYDASHVGLVNVFQRFRFCLGDACEFRLGQSRHGGLLVEILSPPGVESGER